MKFKLLSPFLIILCWLLFQWKLKIHSFIFSRIRSRSVHSRKYSKSTWCPTKNFEVGIFDTEGTYFVLFLHSRFHWYALNFSYFKVKIFLSRPRPFFFCYNYFFEYKSEILKSLIFLPDLDQKFLKKTRAVECTDWLAGQSWHEICRIVDTIAFFYLFFKCQFYFLIALKIIYFYINLN